MAIYALGDLHLSHQGNKPMSIFGPAWRDHPENIRRNWQRVVSESDLVIVPGDISWAMHLPEAEKDLFWLASLPGQKLLIRGNHDYWWSSIRKVRAALPAGVHALQNDHFIWGDRAICGTRGWLCPGESGFEDEHDWKIYERELKRLELSLNSALKAGCNDIIAALHYPPFALPGQESGFTQLLEQAGVRICVYAHIHDQEPEQIFTGQLNDINYIFAAADGVDFTPVLVE